MPVNGTEHYIYPYKMSTNAKAEKPVVYFVTLRTLIHNHTSKPIKALFIPHQRIFFVMKLYRGTTDKGSERRMCVCVGVGGGWEGVVGEHCFQHVRDLAFMVY